MLPEQFSLSFDPPEEPVSLDSLKSQYKEVMKIPYADERQTPDIQREHILKVLQDPETERARLLRISREEDRKENETLYRRWR